MSKFNPHLFWLIVVIFLGLVALVVYGYKDTVDKKLGATSGLIWIIVSIVLIVAIISFGGK